MTRILPLVLFALFLVLPLQTKGEPSYYRIFYPSPNYTPSYTPRYTSTYQNSVYSSPSRYVSYPTSYDNGNKVYVTDKYGRTSVTTGDAINRRILNEDTRSSYKTAGYYYNAPSANRIRFGDYSSPEDKVYITDKYGRTQVSWKYDYYRDRAMTYVSSCASGVCGNNAQCSEVGGRPVCSCLRGYMGDPLSTCRRAECLDNSECRGHQTCRNGNCVNPCDGTCGTNADCETRNHVPVCSCPPGHTGDPFSRCRRFDPSELCHPSPCGPNTNCEVNNGVPTCKCLPGYHGSPLAGCRHECEHDSECGPSQACMEFRCQNPCSQCGKSAECETTRNHQAVCKCPKGYFGNPYSECKPECYGDSDCPASRPACFYGICKNPCDGVCGVGANCELRGLKPICSCPRDMTGDPFTRCRPFEARDLCEPNPCGQNARCEPGFDRYNKERPVCLCHTGYTGNPVTGCVRGECTDDSHCADSQACIDYKCQNPCIGQCGVNAMCNPRRHLAVCTCPPGFQGDALSQCTASAQYRQYQGK